MKDPRRAFEYKIAFGELDHRGHVNAVNWFLRHFGMTKQGVYNYLGWTLEPITLRGIPHNQVKKHSLIPHAWDVYLNKGGI